MLKATPLNELFHKETNQHVERSSLRAEWQARMENELHRARMLGIFNELDQEAYFDDNSDDGFPHRGLPIFARNEQICQKLDMRQRKRKNEAEED